MIAAVILVAIAGLYTVWAVGVTGGPNHGEHPLIVSIVHGVVFFFAARGWPALSHYLYMSGLCAALLASFGAIFFGATDRPAVQWTIRALLALLYAGFLAILFVRL